MTYTEFDTVPSRFGLHSRIALALAHADIDSKTQQKITAFGSTVQDNVVVYDYVQDLINASATVWNELLDHPFPHELAKGSAPLNGFRHYMIQDGSYLEYYYRVNMEAIGKSGTFEELTEFAAKLSSSLAYVASFRADCTKLLGVPANDVANEPKSQQLQNSIQLYKDVLTSGDWLDIHIVLLPCILGYNIIANTLLRDPETVRNTVYFPMWVQGNAGGSSAAKYRTFINTNIGNLSEDERRRRWPGWLRNFQTACGTEKAFFGLAAPTVYSAYNIVGNRNYKIRSYRTGNPYLASSGSSVVTQANDPGASGIWIVTNGADGYTIQNNRNYLGASIGPMIQPVYDAGVSELMYQWSINPVEVSGQNGTYQAYQLFIPTRLQLVLDSGSNVQNPKAFVANNSQISSQLWLLEPVA